jgi:hypothetical protein
MTLRVLIMILGIAALVAQSKEDRTKQHKIDALQSKLKHNEDGINLLVGQGKLARSEARTLLIMTENE